MTVPCHELCHKKSKRTQETCKLSFRPQRSEEPESPAGNSPQPEPECSTENALLRIVALWGRIYSAAVSDARAAAASCTRKRRRMNPALKKQSVLKSAMRQQHVSTTCLNTTSQQHAPIPQDHVHQPAGGARLSNRFATGTDPVTATPALLWILTALVAGALLLSGWQPYDRLTWFMEVAPVLIAAPILFVSKKKFPLTRLLYLLIAAHALVLILGGAYTYARVPLGNWLQDAFELARNPYDKIGHFMQGFVPAMVAREVFIRHRVINGSKMLFFLCCCVVLAVSASYELIEWWAALAMGQGADEFLGLQGDEWDTQGDMFFALIGALAALLLLSRRHDRELAGLITTRR